MSFTPDGGSMGHVTMGMLRRDRKLLECGCYSCRHHSYLDPAQLPFDDSQSVPEAHRRMKCSKCGSRTVWTRPDARVQGVTGQYPQF